MTRAESLIGDYNYPSRYKVGAGRSQELPELCRLRGMKRPLVVTDRGVQGLPWFEPLMGALKKAGLEVFVFADVRSNPLAEEVRHAISFLKENACDGVILLGGGSAMDVGKCVALAANNPGDVLDYEDGAEDVPHAQAANILPMIALPTTAGTGSEVGRAAVIVNERQEKVVIFHPDLQPHDVIADPRLTLGLPATLTAHTGVDAFTHCFEAWCSPGFHPMADGIALEGMRLIKEFLPRAYANGQDLEARTQLIVASSMGATAFQKGLGVVHAISHALGGKLGVHHGLANAIMLPYCMVFNREAIETRCSIVARHLGLAPANFEELLLWVLQFRAELGIPHTLQGVAQMSPDMARTLAPLAKRDASLAGNPKKANEADLEQIMRNALLGNLQ